MGVTAALYLVGWTVLMGFAAVVSWKRFSKRPGADSVRSLRLEAIGNSLFFGAIAAAPFALLLGRAMPQHRVLLSQIVVCGLLAGGLAWFASRLALPLNARTPSEHDEGEARHLAGVLSRPASSPPSGCFPPSLACSLWE